MQRSHTATSNSSKRTWALTLALAAISQKQEGDRIAIFVGLLFSIIIHLLLLIGSYTLSFLPVAIDKKNDAQPENTFEIFIETNSNLEEEIPHQKTPFFSSKNQSAAEELPAPSEDSPLPSSPKSIDYAHKIIREEPAYVPLKEGSEPQSATDNSQELNQNKDTLPIQDIEPGYEKLEITAPIIQRPSPMSRPQIKNINVEGPLRYSSAASQRLGARAVDARFTQYGEYLAGMIEAVGTQWTLLCHSSYRNLSDQGTEVFLSFYINSDGEVIELMIDRSSASTLGESLCKDAILSRSPFGKWTEEMIKTLGLEAQVIKVHFSYL